MRIVVYYFTPYFIMSLFFYWIILNMWPSISTHHEIFGFSKSIGATFENLSFLSWIGALIYFLLLLIINRLPKNRNFFHLHVIFKVIHYIGCIKLFDLFWTFHDYGVQYVTKNFLRHRLHSTLVFYLFIHWLIKLLE